MLIKIKLKLYLSKKIFFYQNSINVGIISHKIVGGKFEIIPTMPFLKNCFTGKEVKVDFFFHFPDSDNIMV